MPSVIVPNSTLGPIKKPTFAAECRFFIPGRQPVGSGGPQDISGAGNHAIVQPNQTDAALWASAGAIATGVGTAGVAKGFTIPAAGWDWDAGNGDSFILAFQVRRPAGLPTAGLRVVGDAPSGTTKGLVIGIDTTGKLQPRLSDDAAHSYLAGSSNTVVVATVAWHTVVLMFDTYLKLHRIYIDAMSNFVSTGTPSLGLAGANTNGGPSQLLTFGSTDSTGGIGTIDMQFRNLQAYVYKGSALPVNWYQLIKGMLENPFMPMRGA